MPTDPNKNTISGAPGTRRIYDAGSHPTIAFDTKGARYFSCAVFDINDDASGICVTQSPPGAKGALAARSSAR
ncbi:MAG: hypothetical protein M3301_00815 [Chloroflexota bacterium]|nr:hypothetical protein [Chloroflexota bacterium]